MKIVRRSLLVLSLFAACKETPNEPGVRETPDRVVVLNGTGLTGVTVVSDASEAHTHLAFDPFDGATLTVANDTALSTSSSFSGNLLYVATLPTRAVQKVQLPANSNPGGAAFIPPTLAGANGARIAVALRNAGSVALVRTGATPTVTTVAGAGLCPYDVLPYGDAIYVVDANQRCASDFATQGPVRLIRLAPGTAARDTVTLSAGSLGAPRAFVQGDFAYVFTAGAAGPGGAITASAALAKVDLRTRQVVRTVTFPATIFGFGARLAENGTLYITAATGFSEQTLQVYAVDVASMSFVGPLVSGQQFLDLRTDTGATARCSAATADASGRMYCVENGRTTATLRVFDRNGRQTRATPVGSPAFDIALR